MVARIRRRIGQAMARKPPTLGKRWIYFLDAIVLGAALAFAVAGLRNNTATDQGACEKVGKQHQLELRDDAFSKNKLTLQQCDTIKIVNLDSRAYRLAFGVHDRHLEYPGFAETNLGPNEFVVVD